MKTMRLLKFPQKILGNLNTALAMTLLLLGTSINSLHAQSGDKVASFYNSVNGTVTNQTTVNPGEQFTLTVGVTSPEEMSGITLSLQWDPEILQVAENGIADVSTSPFVVSLAEDIYNEQGYLSISKANVSSPSPVGTFDIVTITFDVNPDIAVTTNTTIEHVTQNIDGIEPDKNIGASEIAWGTGSVLSLGADARPSFSVLIDVPVIWDCPNLEANIDDTCDDGDDMTENDTVTADCECVGTPIVVFDCPNLEANIGDTCDDGDDMTENDTVTADCECAGTPIVVFDCPNLEANIGDTCDDGDDMTENDMVTADCECEGTPIVVFDCPNLEANIGDTCDDGDDMTENDTVTADCECVGTPIVVFDCPNLEANIGDACDDGDDMTENDMVTADCECAGTPIVVFDCPNLEANIGDACDDGDDMTENDMVTADCECVGTPIVVEYDCPNWEANIGDPCELPGGEGQLNSNCECIPTVVPSCEDFVYYLSDHDAADGIADIYQVTLSGGIATMNYIETSPIEVHIAYNPNDNLLYAISKHENSYRILDPVLKIWEPEVSLGQDLGEVTAAVFNHDGKLLLGSQNHKVIYSVNVNTNVVSTYDTYAPVYGGDLAYRSDGMLYLATRAGNGLYEVWSAPMNDNLIGYLPSKVTGMAITDQDQLLVSAQGQTSLVVRNTDGSDPAIAYNLMLNEEPYTLRDGDMASGCNTRPPVEEYCSDFSTYYVNHGEGIVGSNLYKVNFTTGAYANLSLITNVDYEAHIAFNADSNLIYMVNANGDFLRTYDVTAGDFVTPDLPIIGDFSKVTAVVYNPMDGLLYIGEHHLDKIYTVDLSTGVSAYYADGPVSGGDLDMLDNGDLYVATRQGAALYKIIQGAPAEYVGNIPPTVNGMARANDFTNSFMVSNKNATVFTQIHAMDGTTIATYDIRLDGVPFTTQDGDMASGCADNAGAVEPPLNPFIAIDSHSVLSTYPNPTKGPSKVVFTTGETTRTIVEVYDMNGRNVGTLFNQEAQKGKEYTLDFDGSNLANGVYIYRMTTGKETLIEKFMIAR